MFKFEEYPEIKKAHELYNKFSKKMYKEEIKTLTKNGDEHYKDWDKAITNALEFKTFVYSKIVFVAFSKLKPMLVCDKSGEKVSWDVVFGQNFDILIDGQKKQIAMLVENEFPYRLPDEYYNNLDWFEEEKKKEQFRIKR